MLCFIQNVIVNVFQISVQFLNLKEKKRNINFLYHYFIPVEFLNLNLCYKQDGEFECKEVEFKRIQVIFDYKSLFRAHKLDGGEYFMEKLHPQALQMPNSHSSHRCQRFWMWADPLMVRLVSSYLTGQIWPLTPEWPWGAPPNGCTLARGDVYSALGHTHSDQS